ncbi:hypothetical protein FN846DRAFT_949717, partial [Sphaerosporella brunnea]
SFDTAYQRVGPQSYTDVPSTSESPSSSDCAGKELPRKTTFFARNTGWRPATLKLPFLLFFAFVTILMIIGAELTLRRSQAHGERRDEYLVNYGPLAIGVLYGILYVSIDHNVKRQIVKPGGVTAEHSLLLEYPYVLTIAAPFIAVRKSLHVGITDMGGFNIIYDILTITYGITPLMSTILAKEPNVQRTSNFEIKGEDRITTSFSIWLSINILTVAAEFTVGLRALPFESAVNTDLLLGRNGLPSQQYIRPIWIASRIVRVFTLLLPQDPRFITKLAHTQSGDLLSSWLVFARGQYSQYFTNRYWIPKSSVARYRMRTNISLAMLYTPELATFTAIAETAEAQRRLHIATLLCSHPCAERLLRFSYSRRSIGCDPGSIASAMASVDTCVLEHFKMQKNRSPQGIGLPDRFGSTSHATIFDDGCSLRWKLCLSFRASRVAQLIRSRRSRAAIADARISLGVNYDLETAALRTVAALRVRTICLRFGACYLLGQRACGCIGRSYRGTDNNSFHANIYAGAPTTKNTPHQHRTAYGTTNIRLLWNNSILARGILELPGPTPVSRKHLQKHLRTSESWTKRTSGNSATRTSDRSWSGGILNATMGKTIEAADDLVNQHNGTALSGLLTVVSQRWLRGTGKEQRTSFSIPVRCSVSTAQYGRRTFTDTHRAMAHPQLEQEATKKQPRLDLYSYPEESARSMAALHGHQVFAADQRSAETAETVYWETRIVMAPVAVYLFIPAIVAVYFSMYSAFTVHAPTTLAGLYASGTETIRNKERRKRLEMLGNTYGYGWYLGKDGGKHVGIEKEPLLGRRSDHRV